MNHPDTRIGSWTYEAERKVFVHDDPDYYECDAEDMQTSAAVLDWIAQVANKPWVTQADVADLVRIIDEVVGLQANLCGGGVEHGNRPTPQGGFPGESKPTLTFVDNSRGEMLIVALCGVCGKPVGPDGILAGETGQPVRGFCRGACAEVSQAKYPAWTEIKNILEFEDQRSDFGRWMDGEMALEDVGKRSKKPKPVKKRRKVSRLVRVPSRRGQL